MCRMMSWGRREGKGRDGMHERGDWPKMGEGRVFGNRGRWVGRSGGRRGCKFLVVAFIFSVKRKVIT